MDCLICQRLAAWRQGSNPHVICELEHSLFVVGDHQFHRGYSLVLFKQHVRELHELSAAMQTTLFQEVMYAANAIVATFHPYKMNYACYGNSEPHVHWHIIPRYQTDPDRRSHPWRHAAEFSQYTISATTAEALAHQIRSNITAPFYRFP